jgi:pimeloyl-ACP methyl ester carboxylesterase
MEWIWISIAVIAFIAIVLICVALYLFNLAVPRVKSDALDHPTTKGIMKYWGEYIPAIDANKTWFYASGPEPVSITSYDGLKLWGWYLANPGSDKTILFVHGYRSEGPTFDFGYEIRACYEKGFNVMLIDQRAHGKSEGRYICFGVKERYDVRDWVNFIKESYAPSTLFLYGLSMGCTTVLMASSLELPDTVRGIIAD